MIAVTACALVAAAWLTQVSVGGSGPAGKSGAGAQVALQLAVLEYPGRGAARIAERYARRVKALSNGSMHVSITYWRLKVPPATASREIEASAIGAVRSNDLQLGLLPSHAFQAQGVTTLEALQAPFLITSDALAARVAVGPLADRLQAGLDAVSLTGLGLVPEGLDRPFGYLKPLLTPSDFAGVTVRADPSGATRDLLRALGAHPADINTTDSDTAVYSGFVNDAESIPSAGDQFPNSAYAAGNIVLFPRVDVVVASNSALRHLRPSQRSILRRAAAEARDETIAAAGEREQAAAFCRGGGTIVSAPAAALHALHARAAVVLAAMRRDPATKALIASIERLEPGGPAIRPCTPTQPAPSAGSSYINYKAAVRNSLMPPAGSYRRAFTGAELRAAGADKTDVRGNEGLTTLTFYGPPWSLRFVFEWQRSSRPPCLGRADLPRRFVELDWNPTTPCEGHVAFSWRRGSHGDLDIVALDPQTEPAWLRRAYPGTWKRVECTPDAGWPGPRRVSAPRCAGRRLPVPRGLRGKPVYSGDGKRFVVEQVTPTNGDVLWIANPDGSRYTQLTSHHPGSGRSGCPCDGSPAFSPDGKRIAYVRTLPGGKAALFVVGADGTGSTQLTPWSLRNGAKAEWTRDGPRLGQR